MSDVPISYQETLAIKDEPITEDQEKPAETAAASPSASPTSVITTASSSPSSVVVEVVRGGAVQNGASVKRRRTDDYDEGIAMPHCQMKTRLNSIERQLPPHHYITAAARVPQHPHFFIHVRHSPWVYHTEEWKARGCTMYTPLPEDMMINTLSLEQISFETDQFFLADDRGNYMGAKPGSAIHLWKFDNNLKKLYISRSVLFLKEQDFLEIRHQLQQL